MEQVLHPQAPVAGPDKISRRGWCSIAWPVGAGAWVAAPPASRRVTGHHPGCSFQAHLTWAVVSKYRHLIRGNSVLTSSAEGDPARHRQVPMPLSSS